MTNASVVPKDYRWSRTRRVAFALGILALGGCDHFPQDPDNTLAAIREHRAVRVGIDAPLPPEAATLLTEIEHATGARAQITRGGVEPLLAKLDNGEIDMVVAPFRKETPWAAQVALSPPVRVEGDGENALEWRAAMRTGENRWIMLVEINARRASSAPGKS